MSDFQTQVNVVQAPAVEGDFCDSNYRASADAGPGGFVAGSAGVLVGRFVWADYTGIDVDNAPTIVNNSGFGTPTGFIHREQQALITAYLGSSSMTVPQGFGVTVMRKGGFWAKNANASAAALRGMKAYAKLSDGSVRFKATGTAETTSTTGSIAAKTATLTGSISGNVLTVTAASGDPLYAGATLNTSTSPKVVSQLSGTAGGIGTYALDQGELSVASTSISGTYGLLTVTVAGTYPLSVGSVLSGSGGGGVTAGSVLRQIVTGTGGVGTYAVDPSQTVTSSTIVGTTDVETDWQAVSAGAVGELVKMTNVATL